jgi:hypothetical protein
MTHPAIKNIEWRLSAALRDIEEAYGTSFVAERGIAEAITRVAATCRENSDLLYEGGGQPN